MGTQVLGSTSGPANNNAYVYEAYSDGDIFKANSAATAPVELYIDQVYIYCGSYSGTQYMQFAVYDAGGDGGNLLGGTPNSGPYGVGYGWNHGAFGQGSFVHIASGGKVSAAVYAANNIQTAGLQNGGSFWFHNGGWPSPFSGSQITGLGDLAWYVTYFPAASISGLSTSVTPPGSQFTVSGQSFSAGVTAVSVGGVACPSWTVNSDTSLTVTAPSQGVTGQVQVVTYAGTATSSGSLTVGQVWDNPGSGTVSAPIAVWTNPGGAGVKEIVAIWVSNGSGGVKRIW